MTPNVSWVLKEAAEISSRPDKVKYLQENETEVLKQVLRLAFDKRINWLVPRGRIEYTKCLTTYKNNMFYNRARELYMYLEGGAPNMPQEKREKKFIALLEEIHPDDARMLIWAKNNRDKDRINPYKTLTRNIVSEAFPGLLPDVE